MKTNETKTTSKGYTVNLNAQGTKEANAIHDRGVYVRVGSWDYPDGTEGGELRFWENRYTGELELYDYDGCFNLPEDIIDFLDGEDKIDVDNVAESLGYRKTFHVLHDVTYTTESTVKARNIEEAVQKAEQRAQQEHANVRWETGAYHGAKFYQATQVDEDDNIVAEWFEGEV